MTVHFTAARTVEEDELPARAANAQFARLAVVRLQPFDCPCGERKDQVVPEIFGRDPLLVRRVRTVRAGDLVKVPAALLGGALEDTDGFRVCRIGPPGPEGPHERQTGHLSPKGAEVPLARPVRRMVEKQRRVADE